MSGGGCGLVTVNRLVPPDELGRRGGVELLDWVALEVGIGAAIGLAGTTAGVGRVEPNSSAKPLTKRGAAYGVP